MTRLVITGEPDGRSHRIILDGLGGSLTAASLRTLLALARPKLSGAKGKRQFVRLHPMSMSRLRHELGDIIGEEEGYRLVGGGRGCRYVSTLEKNEIEVRERFRMCPLDDADLRKLRDAIFPAKNRRLTHQRK